MSSNMSSASATSSSSHSDVDDTPSPPVLRLPPLSSLNTQTPLQIPAAYQRIPAYQPPSLFRDFFRAMSETAARRQATDTPPNYQDTVHDVNRALQSANRAIQTAQEAFHQARRIRRGENPTADQQAVDLTGSSPELSAEVFFISQTTHPHDPASNQRSRRLNALNEPVYGPRPHLPPPIEPPESIPLLRLWPLLPPPPPRFPLSLHEHSRLQSIADEEAITRQRENHSNWERTQARNRQRNHTSDTTPPAAGTLPMAPPLSSSSASAFTPSSGSAASSPSSSPASRTTERRRPVSASAEDPTIESVDLTGVDDKESLSAALAKQRQDAILSQNAGTESGRTPLTAYKCPVCMDTPTDATSTVCGHVFCHQCIVDTLNWSVEQRREDAPPTRKVKGVCPVCRKPLDIKDTSGPGRNLVPLELKLMTRKRKREDKGKQKLVKAETISDDDDEADKDDLLGSEKENTRAGKVRKRESTEEALWGEFIDAGAV